jgi:hypothetical protein
VQVDVPSDAGVIRFRPVEPSRVMEWAAKEYRRTGRYRPSMFASVSGSGESSEAAEGRLLDAARLDSTGPRSSAGSQWRERLDWPDLRITPNRWNNHTACDLILCTSGCNRQQIFLFDYQELISE